MDFMKLTFKIINNPSCGTPAEKCKTFDSKTAVIGRSNSCDWVLPDPDRFISSKHAEINTINNTFFLKDISSNGTINGINDEAIGNGQQLPISDGQTFLIGDYLIQAELENSLDHPQHPSVANENADWNNQMDDFWGNSSDPLDLLSPNKSSNTANESPEVIPSLTNSLERTPAFKQAMSFSQKEDLSLELPIQDELASGIPENWDNTSFSFPEPADNSIDHAKKTADQLNVTNTSVASHQKDLVLDGISDDDFFLGLTEDDLFSDDIPTTPPPSPSKLERPASTRPRKRKTPEESISTPLNINSDNLLDLAKKSFEEQGFSHELLTEDVANQWLALMPTVMQSTIDLLQARAAIKNEFRVSKTLLTTSENNPLKFSANAEDAINSLFHQKRPGFLSSNLAFQQAFKDINQHQSALLHGVRIAMMELLKQFDAEALEESFTKTNKNSGLLEKFSSTKSSQAKLWQQYKDLYKSEYKIDSDDSFQRIFGETFAQAYDEFNTHD